MQYRDSFSSYHPIINLIYFVSVMTFSMFFMCPSYLLTSLLCACIYYVSLAGDKAKKFLLKVALPVICATSVINPLLTHEGQTIIAYLPSGNPLTLESIIYGVCAGLLLASVMIWFMCLSVVMTSDKFIYIFAKISPQLSLLLSMTLKFIPKFRYRFREQSEICSAFYSGEKKSFIKSVQTAVDCFVSVVSWSFESALDTADSMRSRGYGTRKRTAYSTYRFYGRDKVALVFIVFCVIFIVCGGASGALKTRYYPSFSCEASTMTFMLEVTYFTLCIMPVYLKRKERRQWRFSDLKG